MKKKKYLVKLVKKEKRIIRKEYLNITFNLVFAFLTLLIPIIFNKNILLATIFLILISIIAIIKWRSILTSVIFLFGALGGPISEMIAIYFHIWSYSNTNFVNIPIWLFIVWGNAAAFIYQTAVEIKKLGIRK